MSDRPVAFVTGASRGIGKACSVHLARAGFDVAVSARTVTDGEQREHSSTVKRSDTSPLPGSLSATAALVAEAGSDALIVQPICWTSTLWRPRRPRCWSSGGGWTWW